MKRPTFHRQKVLLTGASSGIGFELARQIAAQGGELLVVARREEPLQELCDSFPGQIHRLALDLAEQSSRVQAIQWVSETWGRLDVLINNAGVGAMGPFVDGDPQRLARIMDVNFIAAAELCRLAYPLLQQSDDASVINMGSVLGHRAVPFKSEYCASKFALHGFSDALRCEWRSQGIRVLLVSPSTTDSPFFDRAIEDTLKRDWKGRSAVPPEHVAKATIRAWQRRKHEVILTAGGKGLVWFDRLFPRIADSLISKWG